MGLEFKYADFAPATFEVRRGSASGEMTFSGYGAYFNNIDSYGDVIQKGAFSRAVTDTRRGIWPIMMLQHGGFLSSSTDLTPIGLWTSMEEDSRGLAVTGRLAPTSMGNTIFTLLSMKPRPALSGLSIGFRTRDYINAPDSRVPKGASRLLTDIDLAEISVVTFPANKLALIDRVGESDVTDPGKTEDMGSLLRTMSRLLASYEPRPRTALEKLQDSLNDVARLAERIAAEARQ